MPRKRHSSERKRSRIRKKETKKRERDELDEDRERDAGSGRMGKIDPERIHTKPHNTDTVYA